MTAAEDERRRIAAILRVAEGARLLDVPVDAKAAISAGISPDDVLALVWSELSFMIASPEPVGTLEELISSLTGKPIT